MKKAFIGIGIVLVIAVIGVVAYVLRPPAEASAPIEALPVNEEQSESAVIEPVEEAAEQNKTEDAEGDELSTVDMADESPAAETGTLIFSIVQSESEVRFTLDELLRGSPTTVVGITDQVAGEIAVDPANPANSQVGTILINARTLATDNDFRNRAIQNEILDTGEFEFITFVPISITGLPGSVAVGDTISFQITGDLTIRDITNQVAFETTVTVVSEERLDGSASATVARADYDLQIPNVPQVADVDEIVLLEIDFVAGVE